MEDFRENSQKKSVLKKNTHGFTLTELIVVISIVLIIAGGAIFGISSWIRWVHFKEQNENARSLYLAAQNQIGEYSAHGQLENKVREKIESPGGSYRNVIDFPTLKLVGSNGNEINLDALWPARKDKADPAKYTGTVCYAMGRKDDYETYCTAPDDLDANGKKEVRMMYDMLVPYLYDPSILKATVCMEFTPDDGQIYSILYSNVDSNSGYYFEYAHTDTKRGAVSIHSRQADYREKRMVGYYGVETLSKVIGTDAQKPVFTDVRLNNEDTLNLSFKVSGVEEAINHMTYTISVYDKSTGRKHMDILLDGSKLSPAGGNYGPEKIAANVIRYGEDGTTKWAVDTGSTPTAFNFLVEQSYDSTSGDNAIKIILDAADISASSNLYKRSLSDLTRTDGTTPVSDVYRAYIGTYSFSRFGINADEIYCTVQGAGSVYRTTTQKQSNSSCVYFETASKTAEETPGETAEEAAGESAEEPTEETPEKRIYTLANGRHLYNIRYIEDGDLYHDTEIEYRINKDISWKQFVEDKGLYYTGKIRDIESSADIHPVIYTMMPSDGPLDTGDGSPSAAVDGVPFPSIGELRDKSVLTSNGVTTAEIKDIFINEDDNIYTLLYADSATGAGADNKGPTGLFATNKGTINNIALDRVRITGTNCVGAFCGINEGNLTALSVKSTETTPGAESTPTPGGTPEAGGTPGTADSASRIEGEDNVGGIAGYDNGAVAAGTTAGTEKKYLRLNNYAVVSGHEGVGGIVGHIYLDSTSLNRILIDGCRNYGEVKAKDVSTVAAGSTEEDPRTKCKYIGGIAGYADNNAAQDKVKFINCNGSPVYTDEETEAIFADEDSLKSKLNGMYVGGIAGYNKNALIEECSAQNITGSSSFLFGYKYVGGITGYNEPAEGTDPATAVLSGANSITGTGIIDTNVIGHSYVGGVSGSNNITLTDWKSRGMTAAAESYAGGITGYNEENASIKNCICDTVTGGMADTIYKADFLKGDYTGGIAGYNKGTVTGTENAQVTVYVAGGSYVGGVIGYNDIKGKVSGYDLTGGYVKGTGAFVGGIIGLNTSPDTFYESETDALANPIRVNPNGITGDFCVGGAIGGNIVTLPERRYVKYDEDNFLGTINAEAYAGGYIGYNHLFGTQTAAGEDVSEENVAESIKEYAKEICVMESEADDWDTTASAPVLKEKYADIITSVRKKDSAHAAASATAPATATAPAATSAPASAAVTDAPLKDSNHELVITGGKGDVTSPSRLEEIKVRIYAGGIVGYNAENTKLRIKNIVNKTPVTASVITENKYENPRSKSDIAYSYSGGIISKVTKYAKVEKCENSAEENNVADGTVYHGGICEVNEGTIISCHAPSAGGSKKDYVGGIAGLNKENGKITGCSLDEGVTITGASYVGGIAAQNYGTITDTTLTGGKVKAYGSCAGGVAADNYGCIVFKKAKEANITVSASGNAGEVGGIAGKNESAGENEPAGEISFSPGPEAGDDLFVLKGNISGEKTVGGLIGNNSSSSTISGWDNHATVTAAKGNAGGIAGINKSEIKGCANSGVISAASGAAGGITAENVSTIENCTNKGKVSSANGDAGGIAAINISKIINCTSDGKAGQSEGSGQDAGSGQGAGADPDDAPGVKYCEIEGRTSAGGIAGDNRKKASIEACSVRYVKVSNINGRSDAESNVGGIAGVNRDGAVISGTTTQKTGNIINVAGSRIVGKVSGNNINIGGVVGKTQGTVENITVGSTGSADGDTVIKLANNISYANMGGIAGNGTGGTITGCTVEANISGNMGSSATGYGGIAGVFGGGEISSCNFSGELSANGSSDNMVCLGGIAGRLKTGASITGCYIGTGKDTVITSGRDNGKTNAAAGYVGGIAGMNEGRIEKSGIENSGMEKRGYNDNSAYNVSITNYAGNTGGIAGELAKTGRVNSCETGSKWNILAVWYISTAGTGGIIGYSSAGTDINDCINRAEVSATYPYSDNVAAAGLIGRLENTSRNGMVVNRFINYGDITGTIAAGAVGRDKFKGLTFNNCINYGTIMSTGDESKAAGGLVGNFMVNNEDGDFIAFNSCINHGNIVSAQNVGGITGYAGKESTVRVTYYDCVNTGALSSGSDKYGGITANTENQEAYFYRCRNYGNSNRKKEDSGIVRNGTNIKRIWYCFNFGFNSGKSMKLSGSSADKEGSYYVTASSTAGDNELVSKEENGVYNLINKDKAKIVTGLNHDVKNDDIIKDDKRIEKDNYTIAMNATDLIAAKNPADLDEEALSAAMDAAQGKKYYRLMNYIDTDPKIAAYYDRLEIGDNGLCDIRENSIEVENTGGNLIIKWEHGKDDTDKIYSGDQLMYKIGDGEWRGPYDVAYGVERYIISGADMIDSSNSITVAIRTYGAEYDTADSRKDGWLDTYGPDAAQKEPNTGNWVFATNNIKDKNQAIPQVHIEFTPTDDNMGAFTAILDNPDDYAGDDKKTTIEISGIQCDEITGDDTSRETTTGTIVFDTATGRSKPFTVKAAVEAPKEEGEESKKVKTSTLNIKARANDTYAESMTVSYMVAFYGADNLKDDHVKTEFGDFYGNTPGGMSAQIKMDSQDGRNTEMYVDSELVIDNYPIGTDSDGKTISLPVAVASGNTHVTSLGGEVASVLDGLPDDTFNHGNITVRTYPWETQSYICRFGHPVKDGDKAAFTKEEIIKYIENESLIDVLRGEKKVFIKNAADSETGTSEAVSATLNDGYVLRQNGDGTYSIIYSSILAYSYEYGAQIDEKVYKLDHENGLITADGETTDDGGYTGKLLSAPVIEKDFTLLEDGNSYTFTWDKDVWANKVPDENVSYELRLIGHDRDSTEGPDANAVDREVLLETATVNVNTSEKPLFSYKFTDKNNNWNYSDITLEVVRVGVVDAQTAKTTEFPAYSEQDFKVKVRFSQIAAPAVSLHRNGGAADKDTLIYDVTWNAVPESQRKEVERYELLIEALNDDGTTQTETIIPCDPNGASEGTASSGDTLKQTVDLNGYKGGQRIRFSVRVIAKDDAETYRDSIEGVAREIVLPTRQETPDVTKLEMQPKYMPHDESGDVTYMTMEEYEKGLKLVLDATGAAEDGRYQLAVAVYDVHSDGNDTDYAQMQAGDAKDISDESYWNSGAEKTLITKASDTVMNGSLSSAVYNIASGIDSDDAGKWLKIALRSISDNNISSWWSDEDAADATTNYKWLRIPRIRVDEPQIKELFTDITYDMDDTYKAVAKQTTLEFGIMKHADGYRIQRVKLVADKTFNDVAYTRQDVDWIYLEPSDKEEDAYNVYVVTSEEAPAEQQATAQPDTEQAEQQATAQPDTKQAEQQATAQPTDVPACEEDEAAVYAGTLKKDLSVEIPISDILPLSSDNKAGIQMKSVLYYDSGKGDDKPVIRIVLPDAESVSISGETYENPDTYYHTSQLSVQATVYNKDHMESYESSPICNWYRTKKNKKWTSGTVTLDDYGEPPELNGVKVEKSGYEGIAYNVLIPSEKQRIYRVTVVDSDKETVLDNRYIGSYYDGDKNETLIALRKDIYDSYKNKFIILKGADITAEEGVSKWSEETEPNKLSE